MAREALSTAELAGMVRQILDSEEREAAEHGMVNCPVCGDLGGMGDLILCGNGADAELRFEHLHVLEVHAGRVGGKLVLDYSRDMPKKCREGYLTTWQDRTIRVWFSPDEGWSQPCPICGVDDWTYPLAISLAVGETCVNIPAQARHLMEGHGLTEYVGLQVWNNPGDFEKLRDFLSVPN